VGLTPAGFLDTKVRGVAVDSSVEYHINPTILYHTISHSYIYRRFTALPYIACTTEYNTYDDQGPEFRDRYLQNIPI
jgi:hypothetical protein